MSLRERDRKVRGIMEGKVRGRVGDRDGEGD